MAGENLSVTVTTPERTIFEGGAELVVVPAWDGEVGVLRRHAPMMVLLGEGTLRIRQGREERRLHVSGGFLQVADNVVSVLSEHAHALTDED